MDVGCDCSWKSGFAVWARPGLCDGMRAPERGEAMMLNALLLLLCLFLLAYLVYALLRPEKF
jgi:K+-transporting ATPase KdpF subunit